MQLRSPSLAKGCSVVLILVGLVWTAILIELPDRTNTSAWRRANLALIMPVAIIAVGIVTWFWFVVRRAR